MLTESFRPVPVTGFVTAEHQSVGNQSYPEYVQHDADNVTVQPYHPHVPLPEFRF